MGDIPLKWWGFPYELATHFQRILYSTVLSQKYLPKSLSPLENYLIISLMVLV